MSLSNNESGLNEILNELISLESRIDRGEGSSEDLEKALSLGASYYQEKTAQEGAKEDNRTVIGLSRESLKYNRALQTGFQGRLQFCGEKIASKVEAATSMDDKDTKVAERYRMQAQNWAKVMASYQPTDIK